jgi:hypothetical protein
MKSFIYMAAVATFAATISATPVFAQLGNLLGGSGGGGVVSNVVNTVTGGGSSGGGSGGGSNAVDLDSSDGDVGATGVATLSFSNNNGTNANAKVLGGGGQGINVPLSQLLGGNSGADLELPNLAALIGGNGGNGIPGAPGTDGTDGTNGGNGYGGGNGSNGMNGINGSSRLKMLLRILQERAWLRFAQGNKLCVSNFGVADVASWVKPREYEKLQQLIVAFGPDIQMLQQMMKRCRNGQNRLVDVARVIGIDLKENGEIVVMTM